MSGEMRAEGWMALTELTDQLYSMEAELWNLSFCEEEETAGMEQLQNFFSIARKEAKAARDKLGTVQDEARQLEQRQRFLRDAVASGKQANLLLNSTEVVHRSAVEQEVEKNRQFQMSQESRLSRWSGEASLLSSQAKQQPEYQEQQAALSHLASQRNRLEQTQLQLNTIARDLETMKTTLEGDRVAWYELRKLTISLAEAGVKKFNLEASLRTLAVKKDGLEAELATHRPALPSSSQASVDASRGSPPTNLTEPGLSAHQRRQQSPLPAPPAQEQRQQRSLAAPQAQEHRQQHPPSVPPAQEHRQQHPPSAPPAQEQRQQRPPSAPLAQEQRQQRPPSVPPAQEQRQQRPPSVPPAQAAAPAPSIQDQGEISESFGLSSEDISLIGESSCSSTRKNMGLMPPPTPRTAKRSLLEDIALFPTLARAREPSLPADTAAAGPAVHFTSRQSLALSQKDFLTQGEESPQHGGESETGRPPTPSPARLHPSAGPQQLSPPEVRPAVGHPLTVAAPGRSDNPALAPADRNDMTATALRSLTPIKRSNNFGELCLGPLGSGWKKKKAVEQEESSRYKLPQLSLSITAGGSPCPDGPCSDEKRHDVAAGDHGQEIKMMTTRPCSSGSGGVERLRRNLYSENWATGGGGGDSLPPPDNRIIQREQKSASPISGGATTSRPTTPVQLTSRQFGEKRQMENIPPSDNRQESSFSFFNFSFDDGMKSPAGTDFSALFGGHDSDDGGDDGSEVDSSAFTSFLHSPTSSKDKDMSFF